MEQGEDGYHRRAVRVYGQYREGEADQFRIYCTDFRPDPAGVQSESIINFVAFAKISLSNMRCLRYNEYKILQIPMGVWENREEIR